MNKKQLIQSNREESLNFKPNKEFEKKYNEKKQKE